MNWNNTSSGVFYKKVICTGITFGKYVCGVATNVFPCGFQTRDRDIHSWVINITRSYLVEGFVTMMELD
ncbi:hypothetical protein BC941DRAFT_469335 [Chlamydoabsidia padenii]|nr:hypothetical protein BC941DRAFT_469335 [Chlamydoabsidia padenii]